MTRNSQLKDSKFSLKPSSTFESWLIFDIETNGLYDSVTEIFCIVIYDVIRKQTVTYGPDSIDSAIEHLHRADVLIGHNIIFYDIPVLRKLTDFKLTAHVIDTLVCTRFVWPKEILYDLDDNHYPQVPDRFKGTAGLKAWGYRLGSKKINFKDFSEYSQEMLDYCIQDVYVNNKLYEHICRQHIAPSAYKLEHDLALAIERQIRSGFPFDVDQCLNLVDDLDFKKRLLEAELKQIFPPTETEEWFTPKVNNAKRGYIKGQPFRKVHTEEFNPGSRQQITDRLKTKYNWQPTKLTDKGNPVLDDEVLAQLSFPEAKPLAEYMLLKKRLGQIKSGRNAWLKLVTEDDVIHGDVITTGCITGRCSHKNPNIAQVPAVYSPYGKECRALWHAPEGNVLIGFDAKALELRCLAGYLAFWDNGKYSDVVIDENQDIHTYNQQMFGVGTRDISKRLLYGILFGCGYAKAGSIINPQEKDQERLIASGRGAIESFMAGVPALAKLKENLRLNLAERGYLIGLDRRPLHCRSDFKALNVLLQSAGAIIMKQVVVNIHDALTDAGLTYGIHWNQHAFIHDEIQLSCLPALQHTIIPLVLQAFVDAGNFYNFKCRIDGDAKVGYRWSDTH